MASKDPNELELDVTDDDLLDADFQDDLTDDELYDDPDNFDENWEDNEAQNKPVKKKTPLFNIILIGGAVLIGAGILVSTLTKSPSQDAASGVTSAQIAPINPDTNNVITPPSGDPNSLANIQDSPVIPAEPVQAPQNTNEPQGFMNDPTQLDQSGQAPSLPETPPTTGFAEAAPAPGASELPLPQQNLPNIDQIKKAAPVVETTIAAPAPVAETQIPAPVISNPQVATEVTPSNREIELQNKLDAAVSRIDVLEKRLAEQQAQTPASAQTSSAEIANLRNAVDRLETKVSQLSNTQVVRSTSSSFNDNAPAKVVVEKAAPAKKKRSTSGSSASKKQSSTSSAKWELRSARPGEAMVGKPGQADLKILRVGDSAAGIGQIQSISQVGGTWVVQGTTGSIKQ